MANRTVSVCKYINLGNGNWRYVRPVMNKNHTCSRPRNSRRARRWRQTFRTSDVIWLDKVRQDLVSLRRLFRVLSLAHDDPGDEMLAVGGFAFAGNLFSQIL